MTQKRVQRRLTAVLAADVVGYSRLMAADETVTLAALKGHLESLIEPLISDHRGRIVKLMGDGILVEFTSVVDAVECGAAIQNGMAVRNSEVPGDRQIWLRIGINLGDVIVDDDDIYGDGVNVAARLEALAEPGGICISSAAHEQVRDKLSFSFQDCGEQELKNISRPVHIYRLAKVGAESTAQSSSIVARGRWLLAAALAASAAVAASLGWFGLQTLTSSKYDEPPDLGPPRLSIAVLPFKDLSGDPNQNYFADALTDDLTADLSRISGSFVISRRSAATFRGKNIDAKSIAQALKVRYLLEGSVRRTKLKASVNVQLTDGLTGQELWADRYERPSGNLHAFQSEVTGRVARALNLELKDAVSRQEFRTDGGSIDSIDLALRAWAEIWNKPQTPATNSAGLEYTRRALELDPNNAEALGVATYAYARAANYGWGMSRAEGVKMGIESGERSLAIDPNNADTTYALGFIYYVAGETQKALELMRQCIQLNRNHAPAYFFSGVSLIRLGKPREAILWVERAFALSPLDPLRSVWYAVIGRAQVILGEDERAIETAQKGVTANRKHVHNYAVLASAYAHLGQTEKARSSLEKLRKLMPGVTVSRYQLMAASTDPTAIKSYQRMIVGLRMAGLAQQ